MRAHQPGGDPDGLVQARPACGPGDGLGLDVEEDRDAVARSVLELAHHQLAAPRGRRPVHGPQRLALHVVAHAVRIEPARAPQGGSAASLPPPAGVREEALQLGDPRPHEDGRLSGDLDLEARQAEWIVRHENPRPEAIAAARNTL